MNADPNLLAIKADIKAMLLASIYSESISEEMYVGLRDLVTSAWGIAGTRLVARYFDATDGEYYVKPDCVEEYRREVEALD